MINSEWIDTFNHAVVADRVPVSGMIELTRRCNLKCVHCYLGEGDDRFGNGEMTTEQVFDVIDQITEAGCLYLAITGGDPMMRKDFPEVYRHAKEKGLLVTVMCDGVLVTKKIVELFQELPPSAVEISLYGATAETYETITRIPGFVPALRARHRSVGGCGHQGSDQDGADELERPRGGRHAAVGDRLRARSANGCGDLSRASTPPTSGPWICGCRRQQVVQIELSDPKSAASWIKYLDRPAPEAPKDKLYVCGAGVTGFYIDPFGYAYPCMMTTRYKYNLLETDFKTLWAERMGELHDKKPRADYECAGCDLQRACASCPGFHDQEHGAEDVKSDYVCDTAKSRWRALQDPQLRAAAQAYEDGTL